MEQGAFCDKSAFLMPCRLDEARLGGFGSRKHWLIGWKAARREVGGRDAGAGLIFG